MLKDKGDSEEFFELPEDIPAFGMKFPAPLDMNLMPLTTQAKIRGDVAMLRNLHELGEHEQVLKLAVYAVTTYQTYLQFVKAQLESVGITMMTPFDRAE